MYGSNLHGLNLQKIRDMLVKNLSEPEDDDDDEEEEDDDKPENVDQAGGSDDEAQARRATRLQATLQRLKTLKAS